MVVSGSGQAELVCLEAYTDADYSYDRIDRQSVSWYMTIINGSVISYGSRKQGLDTQSTMEAEYVAINEGTRDITWQHNGSKHIENRFHYVRNLEDRNKLCVKHCGTEQMVADILTKSLARVKFEYFRSLLGVFPRDEQESNQWKAMAVCSPKRVTLMKWLTDTLQ
ncbi:Polyprotein [Phytophthora palmivora]|uniref:Polyprotein n=1 Tax=Phytophthora palmivora TaxID=4796 RepID=A0A2P4YC21_9STRA|nr:Polyprotein [Phytophthora palmivora]